MGRFAELNRHEKTEKSMYPQLYLQTFWRLELKPQVFVAMSFAEKFKRRFDEVIAPAIRALPYDPRLQPYRVDLARTGDSILTDIMDGIAHSLLILADVSTTGRDSESGFPYRNGNVMYEVGLALASRQPAEVLLVRDDHDRFLFDVSTIPHATIDFSRPDAVSILQQHLLDRLQEQNYFYNARVQVAVHSLSKEEVETLQYMASNSADILKPPPLSLFDKGMTAAVPRLLDKQVIRLAGLAQDGSPAYQLTPLGLVVAEVAHSRLEILQFGSSAWDTR